MGQEKAYESFVNNVKDFIKEQHFQQLQLMSTPSSSPSAAPKNKLYP
jgi:hypothetical protein